MNWPTAGAFSLTDMFKRNIIMLIMGLLELR